MNAIPELFRIFMAILIEERLYIFLGIVVLLTIAFVLWKYRYIIGGWLQNLGRAKEAAPAKPAASARENTSQTSQSPPRHSRAKSSEVAVSDEVRVQRAIARLQNQSSLEPMVTFNTKRLKQEVVRPLLEYLSDLETKLPSTMISCGCFLHVKGKTSDGKSWNGWHSEKILEEMPSELVNLEVDGHLFMEVSNSREQESDRVTFKGWFVGDDKGSWKISSRRLRYDSPAQDREYEVSMYDWYQLKQRISKIVANFLEGLTDG